MNITSPSSYDSELPGNAGTLTDVVEHYKVALAALQSEYENALQNVQDNPSDPGALATYQAASADYNVFKNFVSGLVKTLRDLDLTIVRNAQ